MGALESLQQDVWLAGRGIRRQTRGSLAIVAVLALGIGPTLAMLGLAQAVLWRPLPYPDSDRLTLVRITLKNQERLPSLSEPEYQALVDRTTSFDATAAVWVGAGAVTDATVPEQVRVGWATASLLPLLGTTPVLGRNFTRSEELPEAPNVAIVSYAFWMSHFGGDPAAVGRDLALDGTRYRVIGVLPRGFRMVMPADASVPPEVQVWHTTQTDFRASRSNVHWVRMLARLRPGRRLADAQQDVSAVASFLQRAGSAYADSGLAFTVVDLHADAVKTIRTSLVVVTAGAVLVLIVACTNVSSLLAARWAGRRRDFALRAALGASRARLVRGATVEAMLLFGAGTVLAFGLAKAAIGLCAALLPPDLPGASDASVSGSAVALGLLATAACALAATLTPAALAGGADASDILRHSGRATTGAESLGRRLLVAAQLAASIVLVVGGMLIVRSLSALTAVPLGFSPAHVLTAKVSLPYGKYRGGDAQGRFAREVLATLSDAPGITAAGAVSELPLSGEFSTTQYAYDAATERAWGALAADDRTITPGYLEAVGARVVAGRTFTWADDQPGREVVIVDEGLARKAWPGRDPVGRRIKVLPLGARAPRWMDVIGVVEHLHQESLAHVSREQIFLLPRSSPMNRVSFVIRTTNDGAAALAALWRGVQRADPMVPVYDARPLAEYVAHAAAPQRLALQLLGGFALLTLVLAATGVYGLVGTHVRERSREFGVRRALGAPAASIAWLAVREAGAWAAIAGVTGGAAAILLARAARGLLFGVEPLDPLTFVVAAGVLTGIVTLASAAPLRRAIRIDPGVALREQP